MDPRAYLYRCPRGCAPSWTELDGRERFTHEPHCPEPERDGWIEALLGARLAQTARLLAADETVPLEAASRTYARWSQLYHVHVGERVVPLARCGDRADHGGHRWGSGFCAGNREIVEAVS